MGKGAVRRPSFLSPGPTAVRAFFFSFPSGLSGLCRRRADLLRGRIPGRAPLRLQFSCASLSSVSVHPSVSCLRAHFSLHAPFRPVASPSRADDKPHLLPLSRVEPTAGCTSCRLSVQLLFRVEPTAGLHLQPLLRPAAFSCRVDDGPHLLPPLRPAAFACRTDDGLHFPPSGYPGNEWPYPVRQSSVVHPAFCFIP